MKNLFLACILFTTPVFAQDVKQQMSEILKEDSNTVIKYAVIGVLQSMIEDKNNINDKKLIHDTRIIIDSLKYSSLIDVNNKVSNTLDPLIENIVNMSLTNPNTFIQYVIIGKRIVG